MSYCWYYSQEDIELRTPSREDGVPLHVETRYRRDGARFIVTASNTLNLRYETPATGVVFFHRFFMIQSFKQFNRWVVAASCLLLAGKVEETPKKCRDILKVAQSILTEQQMANFGSNPKEELLTHERILLQTIKFDLQVQHPYAFLLKYAKALRGDKHKTEKLVQTAWTFVNDSLSTVLCLQWEPQAVAVAFLYLAGKLTKFDLQAITGSKSRSWWRQFVDTLDIHDLDTICREVLDTYGEAETSNSQDEDEPDTSYETPHQTPPSVASIPPSVAVIPSTGVGHTTSSHLPLTSSSSSVAAPMQLLSQQSQQQQQQQMLHRANISTLPVTMHNNPTDLVSMASVVSMNPTRLSYSGTSVAANASLVQPSHNQQQQQQQRLQTQQQHQQLGTSVYTGLGATGTVGGAGGGLSLQQQQLQLQQQQQRLQQQQQQLQQLQQLRSGTGSIGYNQQNLVPTQQLSLVTGTSLQQQPQQPASATGARTGNILGSLSKPAVVGNVLGGGGSAAVAVGGSNSVGLPAYGQPQPQPQQHMLGRQQQYHQLMNRGSSLSPHRMTGGPEGGALPPPAKRQALDYMNYPGISHQQQQQQQLSALPTQLPTQLPSVYPRAGFSSPGAHGAQSLSMPRAGTLPQASQMRSMLQASPNFAGSDRRGGTSGSTWQHHK